MVVSYWASWCGPCKVEMPELRDFYQRYHQTNSDFEILAISIDEDRSEAERYAATQKLPFPVLLDPESKTADAYSVEGIPAMLKTSQLGRTGLTVSNICFGTGGLTNGADADTPERIRTAHKTVREIFDGPANFIDTSRIYGRGRSEQRIGDVIRERGGLPKDMRS